MKWATNEILQQFEAAGAQRKHAILTAKDSVVIQGTCYYVSNEGDDANDGRSPESAWKTLAKVSEASLKPGDGVRFHRGDIFRGFLQTYPGVTYAAYGEGEKPKLYGWDKNLGDAALWELCDAEHSIWHLKEKILDCGTAGARRPVEGIMLFAMLPISKGTEDNQGAR